MPQIPRLPGFDHTLAFLRDGYEFLPRRFARLGTDIFEARLLLQETVCVYGREAAELIYGDGRFERRDAAPRRIVKTLFGRGGVQGLDGERHLERKAAFMRLMDDAAIARLVQMFEHQWREALPRWQQQARVDLTIGVRELLARAVCEWAGVPLPDAEVARRAAQLTALADGAGAIGPRHWRARLARIQTNNWLEEVIVDIRSDRLSPPEGSAAHTFAWHRERGELLSSKVAAVELNNVLRPTTVVVLYIAHLVRALDEHRERLEQLDRAWDWGDPRDAEAFVHEVRRLYPFFPFVAARVTAPFEWRGYRFEQGRRVLLDLYGTNRDRRSWDKPGEFRPERFRARDVDPYRFIPQGGGNHRENHRCAGEWITIALMIAAVQMLTREMSYRVSHLEPLNLRRIPAQAPRGLILEEVRAVEASVRTPTPVMVAGL